MSKTLILALALCAPLTLSAAEESAVVPSPSATPDHFELSSPPVTPDPRFNYEAFKYKWPHISLEEARRLHARKDVVFCDGRSRSEWEQSHIPGAVALPLGDFDKSYDAVKKRLKKAKILVSYCHGEGCRLSDHLAQLLVNKGHKDVAVFWGGYPAWSGANLGLEDGKGKVLPTPVPTVAPTQAPQPSTAPAPAPGHP